VFAVTVFFHVLFKWPLYLEFKEVTYERQLDCK
jgi:hypothetical protein